jgi:hypothetical protein
MKPLGWLRVLASVVALSTSAPVLAQELDPSRIVLTGVKDSNPGVPVSGPQEFGTKSFVLRFSAEAKPVSLKLRASGKELLDTRKASDGFYLECRSGKIFFRKLARRPDGLLVFKTANETQRLTFEIRERDKYLVFDLKDLYGIPKASELSLHFGMNADDRVRVMALDFMTDARPQLPVNWNWLWHRHPQDPLGAVALYHRESDDDEDDTILRVWVDEGLPHPQVDAGWTLARAQQWVRDWRAEFSDTSVLWCTAPQSEQELYDLLPYIEKAQLKEVHLMPWTWYSGKHHPWVNDKFFKNGKEGLRAFSEALKAIGARVTLHYNFCEIPFDDPVFVGKQPDEGLGSWGSGKLAQPINPEETTLFFEPGPGVELPFRVDPWWYMCNPPALDVVGYFEFFRVDNEIIRVGEFEGTSGPVWRLRNCTRGLGATDPASHNAQAGMRGLVAMFGLFFLPDPNSSLFSRMTQDLADLVNECGISHLEYDGVNPAYWGNSEWMYRKYLGQFYGKVKRPLTFGSGYGRARPFGYFEYQLNAVKKMQGQELGPRGDIGARIRTDHLSRPASTVDEAHFRMSQAAAFNNRAFPLFFEVHYPSEWRQYGRFDEICQIVADWKGASRLMTEAQREQIRKTLYPPNERGFQSDTVWRLARAGEQFRIRPSKNPLTRKAGDVRWGCMGGELGYVVPQQYIRLGDELELENPFAAQPPQFTIRVMSAVDYDAPENILLQPALDSIQNPTETKLRADGPALVLSAENRESREILNRDPESLLPSWQRKVDMSSHRTVGLWVTGDRSGAVLIVRLPQKHDYAIPLDFEGRRYVEIPNGEVYWSEAAWGGPQKSETGKFDYVTDWFKLGFGKLPPQTSATVKIEGLKALKETAVELKNPTIRAGQGSLAVQGTVHTGEYLEFRGGDKAVVYDKNWDRLRELPTQARGYVMPTGWQKVSVSGESEKKPWLSVRFITEGEPMLVKGGKSEAQ